MNELEQTGTAQRKVSEIEFPYVDLENAVGVAKALYSRSGLSPCDLDELAAALGITMSGGFRLRTAAARMFGLIKKDGRQAYVLAPLGIKIVNNENTNTAYVDAFLSLDLYRKIYDKYRGQKLPPQKAVEHEMAQLGVSEKQTDRARQAFMKSAKQAGFFENGEDRLVRPRTAVLVDTPSGTTAEVETHTLQEDVAQIERQPAKDEKPPILAEPTRHPLIEGLLVTLPQSNTEWDSAGRAAWLRMAASIFDMIYKGNAKLIEVKVEDT